MVGGILIVASPGQAQTRASEARSPRHGGEVRVVAGHQVEFQVDSAGTISVWLRDAEGNRLPPPEDASITLIEAPGCEHTLPLGVDAASQRLAARFDPGRYLSFEALVSLRIAGKWRHVRFRHPSRL
jgi:hypothetical protein